MKHTDPDGTAYWVLPAKGGGYAAMARRRIWRRIEMVEAVP